MWEQALDEAMAELPWYFESLEAMPELRDSWIAAAHAAAGLAATLEERPSEAAGGLQTERQHLQVIAVAEAASAELHVALKTLREPFTRKRWPSSIRNAGRWRPMRGRCEKPRRS